MEKKKDRFKAEGERIRKKQLAEYITAEFERRRRERAPLDAEWKLNARYLAGDQYCDSDAAGQILETEPEYFWQPRRAYNHIAPIIEAKLAKLSRVRPLISVKPNGDDETDYAAAELSEKVVRSAYEKLDLDKVFQQGTDYAETFGTAIYKTVWDNGAGKTIGTDKNGAEIKEGDVKVTAIMPFAIYPDSLYNEEIADCFSIIHASCMRTEDIAYVYGVNVEAEKGISGVLAETKKHGGEESGEENSATVIEYYERQSATFGGGRMVTVCGGEVLYEGPLPFLMGNGGKRDFPFVKQTAVREVGKFFGSSVIKRLIPVQRAYNAVKNRKQEFLNRLSSGVLTVEDGSVDTDDVADSGLKPGKIIVYRQGSQKPEMMKETAMPTEFTNEEARLLSEFNAISGVNEASFSGLSASSASGTALELLFSQDNERLSLEAEGIRRALKDVYKQTLRLYKQFAAVSRIVRVSGDDGAVRSVAFSKNDITADNLETVSENELLYTPTQKKAMLFELYKSGLLGKTDGLTARTRSKLLSLLGYGELDDGKELRDLNIQKAEGENAEMNYMDCELDIADDNSAHIEAHTRYYMAEYERVKSDPALKRRLLKHIAAHKAAEEKTAEKA